MKHSFIDKHSHINSPVHSFDSRLKFLSVLLSIIIIVSEPNGKLMGYIFYAPIIIIFILISRIPLGFIVKRLLIIIPFFFFAALFYPLSFYISGIAVESATYYAALSIFLKALLAVLLLLLLISSEKFHRLLAAMRKIGMPKIVGIVAALMYRYIFILSDEALRTTAARKSRTPGKLKQGKIKVFGNQIAMIFLRSWERSKTIYNAMLSRGFNGTFNNTEKFILRKWDLPVFIGIMLIFLCIRFYENLYFYLN